MTHEDRRESTDERDDIARLVRLAGRRQAVPPGRFERVRATARARWLDEVGSRRRRRVGWTAAGLAAAAALVVALVARDFSGRGGVGSQPAATVQVEALAGPAWVQPGAGDRARRPLEIGERVALGSELLTDDGGRIAIRLSSGHSLRLDASTRLRLVDPRSVALDRGAVYVDSGFEAAQARALVVHTALGLVEEIGTQFEVRSGAESVRVRLREGAVVVHHDGGTERVQAGTELSVSRDGAVTRRSVAAHGADWEWIGTVTPLPDLDGRPARTFLEWVARERGLALAFADDEVARAASETVLGGSIPRLTLDEALDAVLPACRLGYRIEGGALVVTHADADAAPLPAAGDPSAG